MGSSVLSYNDALSSIPPEAWRSDSLLALRNYRDSWIEQQVILQEAYRLQLHRDPDIQKRMDDQRDEILMRSAQQYILSQLSADISVTDEEARSYYQEHKDSFVLEERYLRYRHLIADNLDDARQARVDLLRGIDWRTVAYEYSVNPEVAIRESERFWPESVAGGDVNILNRYLQVIGLSEITVIERIGDQYHFVQLLEERPKGDHPDLEWLLDQIKEWLLLEKRRRAFNSYVKNLYLQAQASNEIVANDVNLPEIVK